MKQPPPPFYFAEIFLCCVLTHLFTLICLDYFCLLPHVSAGLNPLFSVFDNWKTKFVTRIIENARHKVTHKHTHRILLLKYTVYLCTISFWGNKTLYERIFWSIHLINNFCVERIHLYNVFLLFFTSVKYNVQLAHCKWVHALFATLAYTI